MEFGTTFKGLGFVLGGITNKALKDKKVTKEIKKEYKSIVLKADDIGSRNTLLGSYGMAAYFIAMNRCDNLTPEENCNIMESGLRNSKLFKMVMGDAKGYFSEKHMEQRRKWSKETHEHKYKNDWVVNVLEETKDYKFGFDYLECGVCKLCKDEGCPELAKYMCSLDFMISELIGVKLKRTMTLAEGYEKCDFRFSEK